MATSIFENIINNIRNLLRNEGITGMDSINHCIAFILMKYLTIEKCNELDIPEEYAYENFLIDKNTNIKYQDNDSRILSKFYSISAEDEDLLSHLRDKFNFNQLSFKINSPFIFSNILKKLEDVDINFISEEYDIVGIIYEIHLKTGTSNSMRDLGQYFTHRKVIKYMVNLCEPKLKKNGHIETILDPSLGTGGFLTMSIKYLNSKYKNINWEINKSNIYGFDIDENVKNLALLNTFLESGQLFNETIIKNDTLKNDYKLENDTIINNVDIILANEPFGIKGIKFKECCKRIKDLKIDGTKSEPLFLQLMMKSLNKNGRCAVIVPDGVLFNDANLFKDTRKYLIENLNLKKIISLGEKLFLNTGVKSSILFFINDGKTEEIEYLNIKLNNDQLIENSILIVSYEEIKKNKYNLSINKYIKPEEKQIETIEYKKLNEICEIITSKLNSGSMDNNGDYYFYSGIANNPAGLHSTYNFDYLEYIALIKGGGAGVGKYGDQIGLGKVFYLNGKNAVSNGVYILKINDNNIIVKYMYYYLKLIKNNIMDLATYTTGLGNIKQDSIKNIDIPVPSLTIQNKIIKILDLHNEQIERNKKSIESYEELKKIEIELNTQNCEIKNLNKIITVKQGDYITKNDMKEGIYGVYGGGNATYFIDKFNNENKLIIAKDGISEHCVRWVNDKFFVNHHAWTINILDNNELIEKYIYYYLWNIQNKIYKLAEGSAQKGINQLNFLDLTIQIPSLEIQESIIKKCEYYDNQINKLKLENEMLENNNIIDQMLKSIVEDLTISDTEIEINLKEEIIIDEPEIIKVSKSKTSKKVKSK